MKLLIKNKGLGLSLFLGMIFAFFVIIFPGQGNADLFLKKEGSKTSKSSTLFNSKKTDSPSKKSPLFFKKSLKKKDASSLYNKNPAPNSSGVYVPSYAPKTYSAPNDYVHSDVVLKLAQQAALNKARAESAKNFSQIDAIFAQMDREREKLKAQYQEELKQKQAILAAQNKAALLNGTSSEGLSSNSYQHLQAEIDQQDHLHSSGLSKTEKENHQKKKPKKVFLFNNKNTFTKPQKVFNSNQ